MKKMGKRVSFDQIIADFGPKVGLRIMKLYGGCTICSPEAQLREIRNRKLFQDSLRGMELWELARRYRLKESAITPLLVKMRERYPNPAEAGISNL